MPPDTRVNMKMRLELNSGIIGKKKKKVSFCVYVCGGRVGNESNESLEERIPLLTCADLATLPLRLGTER